MGKVSSNAGKDPYLRDGFWEDPKNHFWADKSRTVAYNVSMYREQFKLLKQDGQNGPTSHSQQDKT